MALETSRDAYFPSTLSLYFLRLRSIYHSLFGSDSSLKSLALFSSPPDAKHRILAQPQGWSIRRMWRAVQTQWGYDPGPEPTVVPPAPAPAAAVDAGAGRQREALLANDGLDWARGQGRDRGAEMDDEDDFYQMDGEGDLTGTVAIVALCVILGYLFYFRQNRIPVERPRRNRGVRRPEANAGAGAGADANAVVENGATGVGVGAGPAGGAPIPVPEGGGAEAEGGGGGGGGREEEVAPPALPDDSTSDEDEEGVDGRQLG